MSDGKLRAYYWKVFTAVAEIANLLDISHEVKNLFEAQIKPCRWIFHRLIL